MPYDFDAEGLLVVLEYLPLCLDMVGIDGVFGGILEGLITLTYFLYWQLIYCSGFSSYVNCFFNDCFLLCPITRTTK